MFKEYKEGIQHAVSSNQVTANLLASVVREHQGAATEVLRSYATRPLLVAATKKKDLNGAMAHLADLKRSDPQVDIAFITDPAGVIWVNYPVQTEALGKKYPCRGWPTATMTEWKPYVSEVHKRTTGEQGLAVALCAPILDEKGTIIGIVGAAQTTGFFGKIVSDLGISQDTKITLTDREGQVIYSNRFPYAGEIIRYPSFAFVKQTLRGERGDVEVRDASDEGRIRFVSFAPVKEIGWSVIAEKEKGAVLRSRFDYFLHIGAISGLIFALVLFSMVFLKKRYEQSLALLHVEGELVERERRFSAMMDNLNMMWVEFDRDGTVSSLNPFTLKLTGYSLEEVIGKNWASTFTPERTREAVGKAIQDLFDKGLHVHDEYPILTKAGEERLISWNNTVLMNADKKAVGAIAIGEDITERTRAEKERLLLAAAVDQTVDALAITDAKGRIVYANAAFERINFLRRDELLGKRYDEIPAEGLDHTIRDAQTLGKGWAGHLAKRGRDGIIRELEVTLSPVHDDSGDIRCYVVVERDVTHEINIQRRLRQTQKMEALGRLAGGIAHDFNNILMPIIINTDLALFDVKQGGPAENCLRLISEAANRGKEMVKQILTFSRPKEQERRAARLAPVVREALDFLRTFLPKNIEVRVDIKAEASVVMADTTQMYQVVMNLCSNATQSMQDQGGVLEVRLEETAITPEAAEEHPELIPGLYVKLVVTDTGHGMAPGVIDRAFDPFFTTRKPGEGTGMGLSVVHGIVQSHGGMIIAESNVGTGSTFTVFLPLSKATVTAEEQVPNTIPKGSERILLIDDEKIQVQSATLMLERLGYRVTATTDSQEGLALFQAEPNGFDLVVTDQTMPGMTGVRLAEEILRIRPDIPVILYTGYSQSIDEGRVKTLGIRELMLKPFGVRDMAEAIRRVLNT